MVLISKPVAVQTSRRQHVCVNSSEFIAIFSEISGIYQEILTLPTFRGSRERTVSFLCENTQGFRGYGGGEGG